MRFNYPDSLLDVELESNCLSGLVRPPLYSFDSTQPLSCLGSLVVRECAKQAVCHGFKSHLSSSFFLFCEKRVIQVSCIALLIYVGLRVIIYHLYQGSLKLYISKKYQHDKYIGILHYEIVNTSYRYPL